MVKEIATHRLSCNLEINYWSDIHINIHNSNVILSFILHKRQTNKNGSLTGYLTPKSTLDHISKEGYHGMLAVLPSKASST